MAYELKYPYEWVVLHPSYYGKKGIVYFIENNWEMTRNYLEAEVFEEWIRQRIIEGTKVTINPTIKGEPSKEK